MAPVIREVFEDSVVQQNGLFQSSLQQGCLQLKIALVASRLHTGGGQVVGQRIVEAVIELCPNADLLVVYPENAGYTHPNSQRVRALICPRQPAFQQLFWDKTVLKKALEGFRPDWVWALGNYPVDGAWHQSVLIHDPHLMFDATWFSQETVKNKLKKMLGKWLLSKRLQLVHRFYCQTPAIQKRTASTFSIPLERIGLCAPGIDRVETEPSQADSALKAQVDQRCNGRFVLFYPARCYGHKNHRVILNTYKRFRDELADTVCLWTIEPGDHRDAAKLLNELERERLTDLIVNLGRLSRAEVTACYRSSNALLMPTKLETYGIPFIEAMQYGVAIITSDYDFIRSVCGEAALYVEDEDDPAQIRDAIIQMRDRSELRSSLVSLGQQHFQRLPSWSDSVRSVLRDEGVIEEPVAHRP